MARLQDLAREDMTAAQLRLADRITAAFGTVGGPYKVLIHEAELTERLQDVLDYLRNDLAVPARLRMLATMVVVRYWRAAYAWSVNRPNAIKEGLSEAVLDAIERGEVPHLDRAEDRAVYDASVELLETRALSDATYRRAVEILGEKYLREIVVILGFFAVIALCVNAFEVELRPGAMPPAFARPK